MFPKLKIGCFRPHHSLYFPFEFEVAAPINRRTVENRDLGWLSTSNLLIFGHSTFVPASIAVGCFGEITRALSECKFNAEIGDSVEMKTIESK